MEQKFLPILLLVGILFGCTHLNSSKRVLASTDDESIIGGGEKIILHYKEENFIIVKLCESFHTSGASLDEVKSSCSGTANSVPIKVFKEALRLSVPTRAQKSLRPLNQEEFDAYLNGTLQSEQISDALAELEVVDKFLRLYSSKSQATIDRGEFIKALRFKEVLAALVKKEDMKIGEAIEHIIESDTLSLRKLSEDTDPLLYRALYQFGPNHRFPCGLEGSIEQRITSCSNQLNSEADGFVLVSRTKEFSEIYRELST